MTSFKNRNEPFGAQHSSTSRSVSSSQLVRKYTARYQDFRDQAMKRLHHPFLPWLLLIGLILWVGVSLFQIWLRMQPVLTAHALSQEIQIYQNLIEQKKRLVLELSQKRSQWHSQAQEQFHMIYPTDFVVIPLSTQPSRIPNGAAP